MGNLAHLRLAAGCLLGGSTATQSRRWVTLFRVSILRDRRTVLYAGSHASGRHARVWSHDLRPFPFWASLLTGVGWVSMTTPRCTFTCVIHSHLLNGVTSSGSMFTAFPSRFPRLRTSRTRGEGAVISPTREVGVGEQPDRLYHRTYMDTQLRKSMRLSPLIPRSARPVSSEQVAHTRWSRPGQLGAIL